MTGTGHSNNEFLGGRLTLKQPKKGYRVSSDSVFLAAAIPLKPQERILDMGVGTGGILSCLAARIGGEADNCIMHGIEIQSELVILARENASKNGFDHFTKYFEGDIFNDIHECTPNYYHHVVSNPPYYEKGKISNSSHKSKSVAFGEELEDLKVWIERCVRMVRPKGYLTVIHRADRLDDILTALNAKTGSIIVYPFYSKVENDAKRVIIRAQKDGNGHLTLKSGLIVHKSDGKYTAAAEDILRHAKELDISK